MMDLILFDMDGVLLEPNGYHRAFQDTVRLGASSLGYPSVFLSKGQVAQFEALGFSNEWHSSAMCMAVLLLSPTGESDNFDLEPLFGVLANQPVDMLPLERAAAAVTVLAEENGAPHGEMIDIVMNSESIEQSPTMSIFQELILGSALFEETYDKTGQIGTESYLKLHDQVILSPENAAQIIDWSLGAGQGAAIMTNRPSDGLPGVDSAPDGAMGAELVGLTNLPLVGFSEMDWLAAMLGEESVKVIKPAWQHALAAVLAASGWTVEASLRRSGAMTRDRQGKDLSHLQSSRVTVFEDTPGGLIAVDQCAAVLGEVGIEIEVNKIGISKESSKEKSLKAQGGVVFPNINHALGKFFR